MSQEVQMTENGRAESEIQPFTPGSVQFQSNDRPQWYENSSAIFPNRSIEPFVQMTFQFGPIPSTLERTLDIMSENSEISELRIV